MFTRLVAFQKPLTLLGRIILFTILLLSTTGAIPADVNLIVNVKECNSGQNIEGAQVRIPTAAILAGSESTAITNWRGIARVYPLRFGGQEHTIHVSASGYVSRSIQVNPKPWSSVNVDFCLGRIEEINNEPQPIVSHMKSNGIVYTEEQIPVYKQCQCVAYWSKSQIGHTLSIGVAGLSPDLMISEAYFEKIPDVYGFWSQKSTPEKGDTLIIHSASSMFLYIFTGNAYANYTQLRPGHIGIIESATYLNNKDIELAGKRYEHFHGWQVRFRNANWPSGWMENNRFYSERIGDVDNQIICKNVGVSEIIVPDSQPGITYWGRIQK